jgi:hypothetical protein
MSVTVSDSLLAHAAMLLSFLQEVTSMNWFISRLEHYAVTFFLWFLSVYDGTYEDNQNQKSPFLVKIELHTPADSVQKSHQGCIFLTVTVFRVSQSVAIMKSTIFNFMLDANG